MTYVITDACVDVKDQKCVKECPVDCIYLAERAAYIQPDECIDCGACALVCPVKAIFYQDELKPDQFRSLARQAEVFGAVGSPGGARAFGRLPADHAEISAMPPKPR
jgi:ferredoxin